MLFRIVLTKGKAQNSQEGGEDNNGGGKGGNGCQNGPIKSIQVVFAHMNIKTPEGAETNASTKSPGWFGKPMCCITGRSEPSVSCAEWPSVNRPPSRSRPQGSVPHLVKQ